MACIAEWGAWQNKKLEQREHSPMQHSPELLFFATQLCVHIYICIVKNQLIVFFCTSLLLVYSYVF